MASGIAVKLPLSVDQNDGCYSLLKDYESVIKQNMRCLILTSPGERCMMADYGVGVRNYLFDQNTISNMNDLRAKIYEQVALYMPFVELEDVQIDDLTDGEESVGIKIYYRIIPLGTEDLLSMDIARKIS